LAWNVTILHNTTFNIIDLGRELEQILKRGFGNSFNNPCGQYMKELWSRMLKKKKSLKILMKNNN